MTLGVKGEGSESALEATREVGLPNLNGGTGEGVKEGILMMWGPEGG